MPADQPTILATSGGLRRGSRTFYAFAPLVHYAIELSGVSGRAPRLCHIGTAGGDQRAQQAQFQEAAVVDGIVLSHLNLYPMPSVENMTEFLLGQDAVWVGGGSVANLLALWRLHGLDGALQTAWQAGIVLSGVSAGSICWHIGARPTRLDPICVR
jgi:peptidase E